MRVAVIGHVEHVEFAPVDRIPGPGEIAHAGQGWAVAAGGGAVAAAQLAKLAGSCEFFTVLGDDELGRRCRDEVGAQGVTVHTVFEESQRRALTLVEPDGERTITTIGPKLLPRRAHDLPWHLLEEMDAVFFVAGDEEALRAARGARILTATTRELAVLARAEVHLDAVIGSGRDAGEAYVPFDPSPALVVTTAGSDGGSWTSPDGDGSWRAEPPPGPVVDTYGCGDSFAAGLTFAMARGDGIPAAFETAARCGAACLAGCGPYDAQLRLGTG
jgi:ribokinase